MSDKPDFPILSIWGRLADGSYGKEPDSVGSIPWDVIAPHEKQADRNHSQSLVQLADRCGLSWCEALAVLEDRRWHEMDWREAKAAVLRIIAQAGAA